MLQGLNSLDLTPHLVTHHLLDSYYHLTPNLTGSCLPCGCRQTNKQGHSSLQLPACSSIAAPGKTGSQCSSGSAQQKLRSGEEWQGSCPLYKAKHLKEFALHPFPSLSVQLGPQKGRIEPGKSVTIVAGPQSTAKSE